MPVLFLTEHGTSHYLSTYFYGRNSVCGAYPPLRAFYGGRTPDVTTVVSVHLPSCKRCLRIGIRNPLKVVIKEVESA